jgi:hypothetical protein
VAPGEPDRHAQLLTAALDRLEPALPPAFFLGGRVERAQNPEQVARCLERKRVGSARHGADPES